MKGVFLAQAAVFDEPHSFDPSRHMLKVVEHRCVVNFQLNKGTEAWMLRHGSQVVDSANETSYYLSFSSAVIGFI